MGKETRGTHETMPWLDFTKFIVRTLETCCVSGSHKMPYAIEADHWTTKHFGDRVEPGPGQAFWGGQFFAQENEKGWHPFYIPQGGYWDRLSEDNFYPWSAGIYFSLSEAADCEYDTMTGASCRHGINGGLFSSGYFNERINWDKISGRYYDGQNEWDAFPIEKLAVGDAVQILFSELPREYMGWTNAWHTGYGGCLTVNAREEMFQNGFLWEVINYDPGLDSDDYVKLIWKPLRLKIYFLNTCVNSINKYKFSADGGEDLILYGLGMEIPDEDMGVYSINVGGNYNHQLYQVWLENVITGELVPIYAGDITPNSNTKATIEMPAADPGFYYIKLRGQQQEQPADEILSYAGEYRTWPDGRMYDGDRFVIQIGNPDIPLEPPAPYWRWKWKWGDIEIWEYYAPIDVRSDAIFWEGRVLGVSTITRSIDDFTGMFNIGDANVSLANNDLHFSMLLANYFCKGQVVEISHGRGLEPASWHTMAFLGIVDDHDLEGEAFEVKLKDFSQKYLKKEFPRFTITTDEFPDAHSNSIGRAFNEILGLHSHTTGDAPGSFEAYCVDTTTYTYAMAGGPLHSVPQVYSDGVLISSSNYTLHFDDYGRQFVTFNSDQGNNRITFNCTGYYFSEWDSDNGYVQNPAYILAFFLSLLCDVPINFLHMGSFDELAQIFVDGGWDEIGKFAITTNGLAESFWQELLYSYGAKYWQTMDGKFKVGRKDISNLTYQHVFMAQTDLKEFPKRPFNLNKAVNSAKAVWDYVPAADIYNGAQAGKDQSSINLYGSEIGPDQPWEFKWFTSDSFAEQRITEDILKLAFGDKRITFTISMDYIDSLDIFDNFKLHDPYGLSTTGEGESGRWYYVTSLQYNFQGQTIEVEAVDLQWLLQQYFIFGDEDQMPDTYGLAGDTYRLYGYMCDEDTASFSDGTPGKILIDENLIEED